MRKDRSARLARHGLAQSAAVLLVVVLCASCSQKTRGGGVAHGSTATAAQGSEIRTALASFVVAASEDGVEVVDSRAHTRSTFAEAGRAINWALERMSAGSGGKIFIRSGVYDVETPIVIGTSEAVLEGEGKNATILRTSKPGTLITLLVPETERRLEGVGLFRLGLRQESRASGEGPLIGTSPLNKGRGFDAVIADLRIEDCRFSFAPRGQAAIRVGNPEGVFIIRNQFHRPGSDSRLIHLYAEGYDAGHVHIAQNEFIVGNDRRNVTGILLENRLNQIKRISILHNHFLVMPPSRGTTNVVGVHLLTSTDNPRTEPMQYVLIQGNHFEMGREGIRIEGARGRIGDVMIDGNNFHHQTPEVEERQRFVYLNGATRGVLIERNIFKGYRAGNRTTGIVDEARGGRGADPNQIVNNTFIDVATPIVEAPSTRVAGNRGYPTENRGSATIVAGSKRATVVHGLRGTLRASGIHVTPTNSLGQATRFWIRDVTPTTFVIELDARPRTGPATFAWSARRTR